MPSGCSTLPAHVDPNHPDAAVLQNAVENAVQKTSRPVKAKFMKFQRGAGTPNENPASPLPAPPGAAADGVPAEVLPPAGFGEGFDDDRGGFLNEMLERQRVEEQILEAEVQEGIRQAHDIMGTATDRANDELKYLQESVRAAHDVRADVRVQLLSQISSVIQNRSAVAVELSERRAEQEEQRATALQQQRLTEALLRDQEKIDNLMLRFNALMEEGEFRTAEQEIATNVLEIGERNDWLHESVVGLSAIRNAALGGQLRGRDGHSRPAAT